MSQQTPKLFDASGRPVALGALIGRAGEGSVHEVCGRQNLVAKIYHRDIQPEKAHKLVYMAQHGTGDITRFAAWPVEVLYVKPGGQAAGFLMQKASQCEKIHELYGVKSRLARFPTADWRFLIHTAANLARAFAVIHRAAHVIGDVNEGNVFVTRHATVVLIDCDSFQIVANGRTHLCEVGVDNYTAPELQGASFRDVRREPNHDLFGLAILTFQLLFMGRHPFAGAYLGGGDLPIQRAIGEFRFAYGPYARQRQMRQPPATLPLEAVSPEVARLFEQAFSRDCAVRKSRPSAVNWVDGLVRLERSLCQCARHAGHYYWNGLVKCPWCLIEAQASMVLFPVPAPTAGPTAPALDTGAAWARIEAVPRPAPPPPLPVKPQSALSPSLHISRLQRDLRQWPARLSTMMGIDRRRSAATADVERSLKDARTRLAAQMRQWQHEGSSATFQRCLQELQAKRDQLNDLPALRRRRLDELRRKIQERQRQRFLDTFEIRSAQIAGIGRARTAALLSFGIETASDITASIVQKVPGFGDAITSRLLAWRHAVERRFVFKADAGLDPADVAEIDREIARLRQELEQALRTGPARLEQLRDQRKIQLSVLRNAIEVTQQLVAQAECDLSALK